MSAFDRQDLVSPPITQAAPYAPEADLKILERCIEEDCIWVLGLMEAMREFEARCEGEVPPAAMLPLRESSRQLSESRQTYTSMLTRLLPLELDISRFRTLLADFDRLHQLHAQLVERLRRRLPAAP